MPPNDLPPRFEPWLTALETRHLADLRPSEVTRALRALSATYVQRRHRVAGGAALDGAGKRAAFALYYAPLHYLVVDRVLHALQAQTPRQVVDLGCGTGAAGAAWAARGPTPARVLGLDRHPWAANEARWTYRFFGLDGTARVSDLARLPPLARGTGVVAAYVLNEMTDAARDRIVGQLLGASGQGVAVVIIEPIARGIAPWWASVAERVTTAGGRADEWRFPIRLPEKLSRFASAAGLRQQELTCRSLSVLV